MHLICMWVVFTNVAGSHIAKAHGAQIEPNGWLFALDGYDEKFICQAF
jgi:hypothetical protein